MAARGLMKLILVSAMIMWCATAHANNMEVGGENGWAMPPEKNDDMYNRWASLNRFQVGDTIYFKYKNDSVMAVSEEDYNNCNCTHPIFFSNNGNTRYELDHSGLFYFISGEEDHCEHGQKIIIKVLSRSDDISPSGSSTDKAESTPPPLSPPSEHEHSGTTARIRDFSWVVSVFGLIIMIFADSLLG